MANLLNGGGFNPLSEDALLTQDGSEVAAIPGIAAGGGAAAAGGGAAAAGGSAAAGASAGMGLLPMAGIGLGVGLLKGALIDGPKEARQRKIEAAKARYSPWTGIQPKDVQFADPFGQGLQYGFTGAALNQSLAQQKQGNALAQAQIDYLNSHTAPPQAPQAPQSPLSPQSLPADQAPDFMGPPDLRAIWPQMGRR